MEILILLLLILLNGFFALSEIALVSSKKSRLEQLRSQHQRGADTALLLLQNSERFLSAIQVGITLIGIVTGVYGGLHFAQILAPVFEAFAVTKQYANQIALILVVVLITYVSIVLGELVPKTIALSKPEQIAVRVAPVIQVFSMVFYPFVRLLSFSTGLINRVLGIKKQNEEITEAELRQMIRSATHAGVIEQEQNRLHEMIFYFADKRAKHIMTPRHDVEWVDIDRPPAEVHGKLLNARYGHVIAARKTLDNFTGVISVRAYLLLCNRGTEVNISDVITEPLIIPEALEAQQVLNLFRERHKHIAVVVSEYGSLEGIVTLHDIMESIVGTIPEEGEPDEPDVFVREDSSVLVNGDAPVDVLTGIIENLVIDFDAIDYSTVAGFVLHHLNKIPKTGDTFSFREYRIEIVDMDGKRIDKLLIRRDAV